MTLPGVDNVLRARGQGHKPNRKDQPKQLTTEQALAREKMTPTGHHTHKTTTENVRCNPGSQRHGGHKGAPCRIYRKKDSGGLVICPGFYMNMTQAPHPAIYCHRIRTPQEQTSRALCPWGTGGAVPHPRPRMAPRIRELPLREQSCYRVYTRKPTVKPCFSACVDASLRGKQ